VEPERLRDSVGERLRFRFDNGGEMTGALLEVRPAVGTPLLALLADADFFDDGGRCLQHLGFFPLVLGRIASVEKAPL
jgi:hypothetical protein